VPAKFSHRTVHRPGDGEATAGFGRRRSAFRCERKCKLGGERDTSPGRGVELASSPPNAHPRCETARFPAPPGKESPQPLTLGGLMSHAGSGGWHARRPARATMSVGLLVLRTEEVRCGRGILAASTSLTRVAC
jgi:hypothetical protein